MFQSCIAVAETLPEEQLAGGSDELGSGEICKRVLRLRPHWEVREDGSMEFRERTVSDWEIRSAIYWPPIDYFPNPGPPELKLEAIGEEMTVVECTVTVIVIEFLNLFTPE